MDYLDIDNNQLKLNRILSFFRVDSSKKLGEQKSDEPAEDDFALFDDFITDFDPEEKKSQRHLHPLFSGELQHPLKLFINNKYTTDSFPEDPIEVWDQFILEASDRDILLVLLNQIYFNSDAPANIDFQSSVNNLCGLYQYRILSIPDNLLKILESFHKVLIRKQLLSLVISENFHAGVFVDAFNETVVNLLLSSSDSETIEGVIKYLIISSTPNSGLAKFDNIQLKEYAIFFSKNSEKFLGLDIQKLNLKLIESYLISLNLKYNLKDFYILLNLASNSQEFKSLDSILKYFNNDTELFFFLLSVLDIIYVFEIDLLEESESNISVEDFYNLSYKDLFKKFYKEYLIIIFKNLDDFINQIKQGNRKFTHAAVLDILHKSLIEVFGFDSKKPEYKKLFTDVIILDDRIHKFDKHLGISLSNKPNGDDPSQSYNFSGMVKGLSDIYLLDSSNSLIYENPTNCAHYMRTLVHEFMHLTQDFKSKMFDIYNYYLSMTGQIKSLRLYSVFAEFDARISSGKKDISFEDDFSLLDNDTVSSGEESTEYLNSYMPEGLNKDVKLKLQSIWLKLKESTKPRIEILTVIKKVLKSIKSKDFDNQELLLLKLDIIYNQI